ncbi:ATP-binding cassette domain-containing protein [Aquisalimonas lutea]|uniref:ATP-binding cassette domain-containing protein n=1 Tax=Aquisalimonas lutea TaxID=1327750 RepID=UPI0025B3F0F3|nr:ATP-binding cassette domain-containing protein [Aquisalimonas lutea]MDN3518679.1 ATP-binding cassette domain-containing protein [Aquisalimonas lutea]
MLNLVNLTLRRGREALIENANAVIRPGERVGVVGANGTGKSSLFALIRGELQPDAGECSMPPGLIMAHVAQEMAATSRPAVEFVMDGDAELRQIEAELEHAEAAGDGERMAALHGRIDAIEGYSARARAGALMHGLGFSPEQEDTPVSSFSGGWRMRLNLARALMCRSDVLLLDEPTNHLDLDAVLWLQDWLRGYPGTLLLIAHDRDFLDAVTGRILHLEHRGLHSYTGNYSDFERQRAERLAQQQAAFEKQQAEIARIQRFIDRFRAQANKARQAQSRVKALERMEVVGPAHIDSPFQFSFRAPEHLPRPLLVMDKAAAGYQGTPVVENIELSLAPGDRMGILGPNGAGKSTLVRLLAGEQPLLAGERQGAHQLRIGYFAQHQLEQLDAEASPVLHLQRLDPKARELDLRKFLGGFGIQGDMALQPVAPFSGGEKARLVLAMLVYQRPNLLLLDEPTNHLDLDMRHALTMALQEYQGALVVIAHDRHLLRSTTDRLLLVADGRADVFDGDLDDYARWLAQRRSAGSDTGASTGAATGSGKRRQERQQKARARRELQPLRREVERLEKSVDDLSARLRAMEDQLAEPALYEPERSDDLQALLAEQARLQAAMEQAESDWMAAQERLEGAEDSA